MEPVVLPHTSSSSSFSCFFEIVSLFSLLPYFGKSFGVRSALFRVLSIFSFCFHSRKKASKKGRKRSKFDVVPFDKKIFFGTKNKYRVTRF